jgi:hypothetical protein
MLFMRNLGQNVSELFMYLIMFVALSADGKAARVRMLCLYATHSSRSAPFSFTTCPNTVPCEIWTLSTTVVSITQRIDYDCWKHRKTSQWKNT